MDFIKAIIQATGISCDKWWNADRSGSAVQAVAL
jgi:hypothetical protein